MRKKFAYAAKLALISVAILGAVLGSFGLLAQEVSAATSAEELLKKTLLNGLRICANATYMKKEIIPADYTGISSLMTSDGKADGTILVPTKVGNSLNDGDVSCKELFLGYSGGGGEISGLLSLYGKNDDNLENFGYKIDTATTSGASREGCLSYDYSYPDGNRQKTATTNEVCFEVGSDGDVVIEDWSDVKYDKPSSPVGIQLGFAGSLSGTIDLFSPNVAYVESVIRDLNLSSIRTASWDDIAEEFRENGKKISTLMDSYYQPLGYEFEGANITLDDGESYSVAMKQGNSRLDIMHYLTGDSTIGDVDIRFTENDKYSLYSEYFNMARENYQTLTVASECTSTMQSAKQDTGYAIRIGDEWCAAYGVEDVNESYNIVNERGDGLVNASFADMMEAMMNLNYDEINEINDITDTGLTGGVDPSSDPDADDEPDPCYSNSGAMGWVFCPIISGSSGALEWIYDNILQGFLEVSPELLRSTSDNGTYRAWNIFRNVANVVLIILILIVILSQLTGYGVSNYGIKKMLPRLIAMAIVINLSYVVCQLLVDVSNILGSSIHAFLESIAGDVQKGVTIGDQTLDATSNILTVLMAGGAVALFATGIVSGWALIVPILLAVVTALLAVLFMFILLGIRQAAVVLVVALSPLIVVLYVLPNTQNLAKRGINLFIGLLTMFPLAGLLIGGCHLASAILLTTMSSGTPYAWLLQILATLLLVVPFFLLPWLVKSTFSAANSILGAITSKGQGLSGNLRGRAQGALGESRFAQRAAEHRLQRRSLRQNKAANKRLSKLRTRSEKIQANLDEGKGLYANGAYRKWRQRNLAGTQMALATTATQAASSNKQLDESAATAMGEIYGNDSNDVLANRMRTMLANGEASTETGGRQFAALASMLADRGGAGVSELENLMKDTAFDPDKRELTEAWKKAVTPDFVNKVKGKSIVGGEMAKRISAYQPTIKQDGKVVKNSIKPWTNDDSRTSIQSAKVNDLLNMSDGAFAAAVKQMDNGQIRAIFQDPKNMNMLSQANRTAVKDEYEEVRRGTRHVDVSIPHR